MHLFCKLDFIYQEFKSFEGKYILHGYTGKQNTDIYRYLGESKKLSSHDNAVINNYINYKYTK